MESSEGAKLLLLQLQPHPPHRQAWGLVGHHRRETRAVGRQVPPSQTRRAFAARPGNLVGSAQQLDLPLLQAVARVSRPCAADFRQTGCAGPPM